MFWGEVRAALIGILCAILGGALGIGLYTGHLWMLRHLPTILTVVGWLVVALATFVFACLIHSHFTISPTEDVKPYPNLYLGFSIVLLVPFVLAAGLGTVQARHGFLFMQTFPHMVILESLVVLISYGVGQTRYAPSHLMCGDVDDVLPSFSRAATCLGAAILCLAVVLLVLEIVAPGMGGAVH